MNVKPRLWGNNQLDLIEVPIDGNTALEPGDLISYESNLGVKMDSETEDATFLGVCKDKVRSGDTFPNIVVARKCIVEAAVTSAAYTIGQALMLNVATQKLEAATANSIAWSYQDTGGASVTTLKVLIDTVALGKLFPVSA